MLGSLSGCKWRGLSKFRVITYVCSLHRFFNWAKDHWREFDIEHCLAHRSETRVFKQALRRPQQLSLQ